MKKDIFSYRDYRRYIVDFIRSQPQNGRGMKSSLAQFVGCQNTYISRVLSGQADLSFEQAEAASRFFTLPSIEKKYFLLLFQYNRCSSKEGKSFLQKEMEELKKQSLNIQKRVEVDTFLSESDQEIYYSSWVYAALHVLCSLKSVNSLKDLSLILKQSEDKLIEPFNFLRERKLIAIDEHQRVQVGLTQIHIGEDSHLVSHHHRNWRLQALNAIAERDQKNLHYSSVVTISKKDGFVLKNQIIEFIQNIKAVIRSSEPEEKCFSFNIDFFEIGNQDD